MPTEGATPLRLAAPRMNAGKIGPIAIPAKKNPVFTRMIPRSGKSLESQIPESIKTPQSPPPTTPKNLTT